MAPAHQAQMPQPPAPKALDSLHELRSPPGLDACNRANKLASTIGNKQQDEMSTNAAPIMAVQNVVHCDMINAANMPIRNEPTKTPFLCISDRYEKLDKKGVIHIALECAAAMIRPAWESVKPSDRNRRTMKG